MNKAVIVLALLSIVFFSSTHQFEKKLFNKNFKFPHGRIINGQDAKKGQFPYQVGLIVDNSMDSEFCGGSLITTEYVLTAAHCVANAISVDVVLGALHVNDENEDHVVVTSKDFTIHEDYYNLENDIALIKLPKPVGLTDNIQTIPLTSGSDSFAGVKATASGWGVTADGNTENADTLQYLSSTVLSNNDCKNIDPYQDVIKDTHLCLSGDGGVGTCVGDSGGPLVYNGELIGVVSFGYKFCEDGKPSVFSRVTKFNSWIDSKIH